MFGHIDRITIQFEGPRLWNEADVEPHVTQGTNVRPLVAAILDPHLPNVQRPCLRSLVEQVRLKMASARGPTGSEFERGRLGSSIHHDGCRESLTSYKCPLRPYSSTGSTRLRVGREVLCSTSVCQMRVFPIPRERHGSVVSPWEWAKPYCPLLFFFFRGRGGRTL